MPWFTGTIIVNMVIILIIVATSVSSMLDDADVDTGRALTILREWY
jgi:uncharacterized membrane protein